MYRFVQVRVINIVKLIVHSVTCCHLCPQVITVYDSLHEEELVSHKSDKECKVRFTVMCVHVHVHVIVVTPIYLPFLLQCSHHTEVIEASLLALQQKMTALISDIKDTQNCIEISILDIRKAQSTYIHHHGIPSPLTSHPPLPYLLHLGPWYMSESFVDTSTHKDSDVSLLEPSSKTTKDDPDVTSMSMDSDTIVKLRYVSSSRLQQI